MRNEIRFDEKKLAAAGIRQRADILGVIEAGAFNHIPAVKVLLGTDFSETDYRALLYAMYEDLRVGLLYPSEIHGQDHIERVMLLGAMIACFKKLDAEDTRLLLTACAYHDIGRVNDRRDAAHGKRAADMLMHIPEITDGMYSKEILYAIIAGHSCPDESIDLYMDTYEVKPERREKAKELYYCLKDADNLDRVRLGDLDTGYLRNDISKQLVGAAKEIYRIYSDH